MRYQSPRTVSLPRTKAVLTRGIGERGRSNIWDVALPRRDNREPKTWLYPVYYDYINFSLRYYIFLKFPVLMTRNKGKTYSFWSKTRSDRLGNDFNMQ